MAGAEGLRLASLFAAGAGALEQAHGARLNGDQRRAMRAIATCGSGALGQLHEHCDGCGYATDLPRSCSHRSCPRCQNALTTQWLERQRAKLLPVDYFMVTFTLPAELRALAARQPATVYAALFAAASSTLKGFAERKLHSELGQCAVLHTHNRRLDLHPHVHIVVPGGGINARRRQWRAVKGKYLFNAFALAKVYRARLLRALSEAGLTLPVGAPKIWVVDVCNVGCGEPALEYLSRYLYRGVIRERDLVAYDPQAQRVTFRYRDAQTQQPAYRTLPIADFLWKLLLHVLPQGFHRVREYGFLHPKAKTRLTIVQLLLHVVIRPRTTLEKPPIRCPRCQAPMRLIGVSFRGRPDG